MFKADQKTVRHKVARALEKARKANQTERSGNSEGGQRRHPDSQRMWHEKGLFWGTISFWGACVAIGVGAGLTAAGMVARSFFITAVPFGLIASWCVFELVPNRWVRVGLRIACGILCMAITWTIASYTIRVPMELTISQKSEFTTILKSGIAAPPDWTIISCPEENEQACIFAATFIPVFQRAGWKIDGPNGIPQVERVRLAVPQKAISVVALGPPLVNPQDPDHGVWTKVNPWAQTLKSPFFVVKIYPATQNDPTLSFSKVRIYFGSVPNQ